MSSTEQQPANIVKMLIEKERLESELAHLESHIDTLEKFHLQRWNRGNVYLGFVPQLTSSRAKSNLVVPPHAQVFSLSSSTSKASQSLSYKNVDIHAPTDRFYKP